MADFSKIFEQAQQMQARMQQMQSELEKQTVTAAAGGGMVTVEADGKGTITRVKIDPSVADPKDVEMLEDLVLVAVNEILQHFDVFGIRHAGVDFHPRDRPLSVRFDRHHSSARGGGYSLLLQLRLHL